MTQIGAVQYGKDINKAGPYHPYIWVGCKDCGTKRWVGLVKGVPRRIRCRKCASRTPERREASGRFNKGKFGNKNPCWKGGSRGRATTI